MKNYLLSILALFVCSSILSQGIDMKILPKNRSISVGESTFYNIQITPTGGFNYQLFLEIIESNLPVQVLTSFSQNPAIYPYDSLRLNINASGATPVGYYSIIVQASNGPVSDTDTVFLEVLQEDCYWQNNTPATYYNFKAICAEDDSTIWTGWFDLYRFKNGNWECFDTTNSNLPYGAITNLIHFDSKLWISSEAGLTIFDGVFWTNYNTTNSQIPTRWVSDVAFDSVGNPWVACSSNVNADDGGLVQIDGNTWTIYNSTNSPFPFNNISDVEFDKEGNLWLIFQGDFFSDPPASIGKLENNEWTIYSSSNSCLPELNRIYSLQFDSENNLWACIGSYYIPEESTGIMKFDGEHWEFWHTQTLTPFNHEVLDMECNVVMQDNSSELPSPLCNVLYIDQNDHKWIGMLSESMTMGHGLVHLTEYGWEHFTNSNSLLEFNAIPDITSSPDNTIWLTNIYDFFFTWDYDNLSHYVCSEITWVTELKTKNENDILIYPNPAIRSIFVDLLKESDVKDFVLEIYNSFYKQISIERIKNDVTEIDVSGFKPGLYWLILTNNGRQLLKKKIIVVSP